MDIDPNRSREAYAKPRVYTLGTVSELTTWAKSGGSADAWQQQQGESSDSQSPSDAPASH